MEHHVFLIHVPSNNFNLSAQVSSETVIQYWCEKHPAKSGDEEGEYSSLREDFWGYSLNLALQKVITGPQD